mgnify:CR=1 FL=1
MSVFQLIMKNEKIDSKDGSKETFPPMSWPFFVEFMARWCISGTPDIIGKALVIETFHGLCHFYCQKLKAKLSPVTLSSMELNLLMLEGACNARKLRRWQSGNDQVRGARVGQILQVSCHL